MRRTVSKGSHPQKGKVKYFSRTRLTVFILGDLGDQTFHHSGSGTNFPLPAEKRIGHHLGRLLICKATVLSAEE